MTYDEALVKLTELHKELAANTDVSAVILIADTATGNYRYLCTGFLEVQALLIKALLVSQPALSVLLTTGRPNSPSA